jgi:threonine dehydrogenase-like Zn-dependent dehydrogenase
LSSPEGLVKAIVVQDGKARLRVDYPKPARRPGEALIRALVAGICNTDLEILAGYMAFSGVLGHEFVGVVEEADTRALAGRRVVGEINCPCGECAFCEAGRGSHCRRRTVLGISGRDGAFAEYLTLPEANLHLVHPDMPDETAVFAEPTAAAFRILEQTTPRFDERCAVLGDGKLGLLVAQALAGKCAVTLVGHNERKIALARSLGLTAVLESHLDEKDFDTVVDATGSAEGFAATAKLVRPMGRIIAKTTVAGDVPAPLWRLVVDEITVIGSRCGPFEPALAALRDGSVKVEPLVSARYGLDDFDKALAKAQEPDTLKVLLHPGGVP